MLILKPNKPQKYCSQLPFVTLFPEKFERLIPMHPWEGSVSKGRPPVWESHLVRELELDKLFNLLSVRLLI